MLSQTAEHALRAVLYLARQDGSRPVAADRVASALGAPANYLSKTLNALAKRGILTSTPGRRGGFNLAVPADELSLAEVLGAFDVPGKRPVCLLGGRKCDAHCPCAAHAQWTRIFEASQEPLRQSTIADLLQAVTGPSIETAAD